MTTPNKTAKSVKTTPKAVAKPVAIVVAPAETAVAKVEAVEVALTIAAVENPGKTFKVLEKKIDLKADSEIKMLQANPKRPSSKINKTYEGYKSAKTLAEYAAAFGKGWQAGVKYDYQHGFLSII